PAKRLEPLDARFSQRLAYRHRARIDARATIQLARHLAQRRAGLFLCDRTQHSNVTSIQGRLAARTSCLLNLRPLDHPIPRQRMPRSEHNVRDIVFVYTLSEGVDEMFYAASLVARIRASASQTQAMAAQFDLSWWAMRRRARSFQA